MNSSLANTDAIERLRSLTGPLLQALERSGVAIAASDPSQPDNPLIFVNEAFTALTGYSSDEALGRNCRFLQGERTPAEGIALLRQGVAAGRDVKADVLNFQRDGRQFWNRVAITVVHGDGPAPVLFLATMADVSAEHSRPGMTGSAGAWEWDIAAGRLYADRRFAELHGLDPREAALGLNTSAFFARVAKDDLLRVRIAVAGVLQGAERFSRDFRLTTEDGSVRWVSARGRCTLNDAGDPLLFTGALTDVTDQKRLEEQLRVAQTAGGVGSFQYLSGFGTAEVSAEFCRLLGLHVTDALPVRTINAVVQAGDPPIIASWGSAGADNAANAEMRIRRADTGEERWIARRGELRREGGPTGQRFVGVVYDITASKLSETRLREFAEQLEQMVEARTQERDRLWNLSGDLFVVCGFDGLYRAANPAWHAILGYSVQDLADVRAGSLLHPDDQERGRAMFQGLKHGESMRDFDCRMVAKDGDYRWINWTGIALGDEIFATGRDVTQRKQLEDQLRQSQKMEAVGQLTGGLAHDFNNMLTGIIGSIDIVRRRLADGRTGDIDRFMDAARASAERAAGLTHRLLAFSRRQSLDTRGVEVNALVESMVDLLRRTLGEQIELRVELAPDAWPILSDANQLESALLNLAINARDAMPGGGQLVISTRNVVVGQEQAVLNGVPTGPYTLLSVSDTGAGMPPSVVAKAFDPFFTTKPIGKGTGLGLSMIHGFVHQTGGFVCIDSRVGEGTHVHLYLPQLAGEAVQPDPPGLAMPLPSGAGESVLVVEDDPSVRTLVMEVLRDLGYEAKVASDADGAMAILNSPVQIDVLITDVGLPGLNGRQLADYARERRPDLCVLFMTGYAEGAAVRSEFLDPGMALIAKPFSIDAFAATISEIIQGPQKPQG